MILAVTSLWRAHLFSFFSNIDLQWYYIFFPPLKHIIHDNNNTVAERGLFVFFFLKRLYQARFSQRSRTMGNEYIYMYGFVTGI